MLPGPSYIYECQSCNGLFERRSISSGNTSRAKFRSDGQMSAPMLPTTPLLVACPHCKTSIFLPSTKEVDSYRTYVFTGFLAVEPPSVETLALRAEMKAKKLKYGLTYLRWHYSNAATAKGIEYREEDALVVARASILRRTGQQSLKARRIKVFWVGANLDQDRTQREYLRV